jgi:DNA-binding LytR/AlgR family response regulator
MRRARFAEILRLLAESDVEFIVVGMAAGILQGAPVTTARMEAARDPGRRFLLHLGPGLRQAIDPADIYFVEAIDDDTRVRTRAARPIRDVRPLGEIARVLLEQGFVRSHRNHLVNPAHVREGRRRAGGEDRELRLDPPVNLVLPVSRSAPRALWEAFGEE